MTWLTWRQFRAQAAVGLGCLVALAVVVLITGLHLRHLYDAGGLARCIAHQDCAPSTEAALTEAYPLLSNILDVFVIIAPALVGLFWGAPLVARELESGTFRLAWTQSVSRRRWLIVKLLLVGLAAMALAGLVSLMVTWWAHPLDALERQRYGTFDRRDIVPIGYGAFAFALGATAGVLLRRTLPAMGLTLVLFTAARIAFERLLRVHLLPTRARSFPLNPFTTGYGSSGNAIAGAGQLNLLPAKASIPEGWIASTTIVDRGGRPLTPGVLHSLCTGLPQQAAPPAAPKIARPVGIPGQNNLESCVRKVGASYHELVTYQPAGHYWPLQIIEMSCFLALALLLAAFALWWIARGSARPSQRRLPGSSRARSGDLRPA